MKKALYIFLVVIAFVTFNSCKKEKLENIDRLIYVRNNGADMAAHIHGNGTEKVFLIILHGGPGGGGLEYRSGTTRHNIEKECAVVYFDQRGSGMSEGRYTGDQLSLETMTEDVIALVQTIKHLYGNESRFFVMGHSWGGTLGTSVMLKYQNLFKGWIEVDGGHDLKELYYENIRFFRQVSNEQIALNNNVSYWSEVLNKINAIDSTKYDSDMSNYMNTNAYESIQKLTEDGVVEESTNNQAALERIGSELFSYNPLTKWWNSAFTNTNLSEDGIWESVSFTSRLNEIKIPTLFLWGKYDLVIPPKMGQDAYDAIGASWKKIVIFEKSGHSPMDNEEDKYANEMIDFINTHK